MNKMVLLFGVFLSGLMTGAVVNAAEKIDRVLEVTSDGLVEIRNLRGKLVVEGWAENKVSVVGKLDELTQTFIFKTDAGVTTIDVQLPDESRHRSRQGSDLQVKVPLGSKVSFSGVATDLEFSQINGGLDINSVSGDLKLQAIFGKIDINSVSGKIKISGGDGQLKLSTVSGDVEAKVNSQKIQLSSVSADVSVSSERILLAHLSTVSGDCQLFGQLEKNAEIKINSVSGDAYLVTGKNLNAEVVVETAPGGDIVNELTEDVAKTSFINSQSLKFIAGDGAANIKMSTVSGRVGLKVK